VPLAAGRSAPAVLTGVCEVLIVVAEGMQQMN
jgi:hypothetical protein